MLVCVGVLAGCHHSDSSTPAQVAVPNVVGTTQAAATSTITGAGLKLGNVTTASSATVASGSVISETPAAATKVASGSAVNLTVSTGPAQVAVPNVVGLTQQAATTAITGAGLVVGSVTTASSSTVASGKVISETPSAAAQVASGSAVNLTVSTGVASVTDHFAYVPSATAGTISAYALNSSTGALTALAGSPVTVPGSVQLYEAKVDPSGKFLYVADDTSPGQVFGFSINSTDGSLTAIAGSPFAAGAGSQSLAFDASGAYLYVANFDANTISAYAIDSSNGALMQLAGSPYSVTGTNPNPSQIVSAGNHLFVADFGTNSVDVFTITAGTGALTEGVAGSPFATGTGPDSLAVDPTGAVLYTANSSASVSAFTVNSSTGVLTPVAGNPQAITPYSYISIDPQGKFLFVTENTGVAVYPIDLATGALGTPAAGSPFAAGSAPYSVSIDPTSQFVYVGNDGSANVSEFTLDGTTGVLTAVPGSPVATGANGDFIAIK
jgi:6-phosphogluconolactonase (cycloisomerase 2 family)